VIEHDVFKNLYKLEFSVDGETHYMSFEDVLTVLPKAWFCKKARAHEVRVVQYLVRAAHAACFHTILVRITACTCSSASMVSGHAPTIENR